MLILGPFKFKFEPDPEDDQTGIVRMDTESGYFSETEIGVPLEEWKRFEWLVNKITTK